jgi:hypothetical protein
MKEGACIGEVMRGRGATLTVERESVPPEMGETELRVYRTGEESVDTTRWRMKQSSVRQTLPHSHSYPYTHT